MQKRLCGREQEYGMRLVPFAKDAKTNFVDRIDRNEVLNRILRSIPKVIPAIAIPEYHSQYGPGTLRQTATYRYYWLLNGAKMYIDQESFEASTAEYVGGSLDGVLQEKASERILNKALKQVAESMELRSIAFYKNNIGYDEEREVLSEVTYGCHQNYSYRSASHRNVMRILKNAIPAMLPISGSGHVLHIKGGRFVYCLSQRAEHIIRAVGGDTTENRSIVNLKGRCGHETLVPHCPELSRLHLISRDATRCEFQTWLVDSITHLLLRLAEEGWKLPPDMHLCSPLRELHSLNTKLDLRHQLKTVSGPIATLKYNEIFLKAASQLNPLSENEKKCLEEWSRVLQLFRDGAAAKLVGEIDWVTKWHLLKNQMRRYGFDLNDPRAIQINMEYHNISDSSQESWFARLDEKGFIRHLADRKDIIRAMVRAPMTRAHARSMFIQKCLRSRPFCHSVDQLDWDKAQADHTYIFGGAKDPCSPETTILK
jgi:proteasome accessory factor A